MHFSFIVSVHDFILFEGKSRCRITGNPFFFVHIWMHLWFIVSVYALILYKKKWMPGQRVSISFAILDAFLLYVWCWWYFSWEKEQIPDHRKSIFFSIFGCISLLWLISISFFMGEGTDAGLPEIHIFYPYLDAFLLYGWYLSHSSWGKEQMPDYRKSISFIHIWMHFSYMVDIYLILHGGRNRCRITGNPYLLSIFRCISLLWLIFISFFMGEETDAGLPEIHIFCPYLDAFLFYGWYLSHSSWGKEQMPDYRKSIWLVYII